VCVRENVVVSVSVRERERFKFYLVFAKYVTFFAFWLVVLL
jgi:hypothetical protein